MQFYGVLVGWWGWGFVSGGHASFDIGTNTLTTPEKERKRVGLSWAEVSAPYQTNNGKYYTGQ